MGKLSFGGEFDVLCFSRERKLLWWDRIKNAPTLAGLTDALSVVFGAGAQRTAWYAGLIDHASFTAVSSSDTMASHSGWTEAQNYLAGTRPAWGPLTIANALAVNPSVMSFELTADKVIQGIFLASSSTKGGTAGILWATALFSSPRTLSNGQFLTATYTLRASGG